jgi:predicted phage gp36 major capsid-like protein
VISNRSTLRVDEQRRDLVGDVAVFVELEADGDERPPRVRGDRRLQQRRESSKANLEATAFTTGTGSGQPKGVITAVSAVGGSVIATGTNAVALSDLYTNQAALPARWRPKARWMANLTIINAFRQVPAFTGATTSVVSDATTPPRALGWAVLPFGRSITDHDHVAGAGRCSPDADEAAA